jgi:hypothetical protein
MSDNVSTNLTEGMDRIADALYEMGMHGPGGEMGVLESISVALSGKRDQEQPIGPALADIATAINRLADVFEEGFRRRG